MTHETEVAAQYRLHAEELRTTATKIVDARLRKQLLDVAGDYDHLAEQLDQIADTDKRIRSRQH